MDQNIDQTKEWRGLENDPHAQEEIRTLARTMTNNSTQSLARTLSHIVRDSDDEESLDTPQGQLELDNLDPRLDPNSDSFDAIFWVRNLQALVQSDPEYYKPISLGCCLKDLRITGVAADADYQATVSNIWGKLLTKLYYAIRKDASRNFDIIKPLDALFKPGRLCVVLGRPSAGCTTLLKTISARTYGFNVEKESIISYDGITQSEIKSHFRGDVVYSAEVDDHFPHLTVGQTLEFAARCRTPRNRPAGVTREQFAKHTAAVIMTTYGLSHTYNSKVGNDLVRGVSGGERKRVSIAEVALAGGLIECWDNSTRGLDSAAAVQTLRSLKTNATVRGTTPLIAIYQCSQEGYDLFDDVLLLYEGYEIFFGPADKAKQYFIDMGYVCPQRQTSADFLTSITSPAERIAAHEDVPKTPEEFYNYWRSSPEHAALVADIDEYLQKHSNREKLLEFRQSHKAKQSKHISSKSSYTLSFSMQVKAVIDRNIMRIKGDPSVYLFTILSNTLMGLIISSIFYNLKDTTDSFYFRSAAMFTAILFNSFSSLLEIMSLFEARSIVEKHKTFAFYHPSADALASIITEIPSKAMVCLGFNLIFYFMVNFRRTPGHFFFYMLISMTSTFAMSHLFRTIGAASPSLSASMTPASILLLAITIYVGFTIPKTSMLGWSVWIFRLNVISYAFEAMMANEFSNREFECSTFIPSGGKYNEIPLANKVCAVIGGIPGHSKVQGSDYLKWSYEYYTAHRWRDWGIMLVYVFVFLATYMLLIEFNQGEMQSGEKVVFEKSTLRKLRRERKRDIESQDSKMKDMVNDPSLVKKTTTHMSQMSQNIEFHDVFHWKGVNYDIKIKDETRRILNSVDGWVKPGTLTALMGASGAGKTTLLDVLANRVTMGVVTGDMFVNGKLRDESFQRSTGYVQQQDLHLRTSTVREALRFSAYLRQPFSVSKQEKDEYVEEVIEILEMEKYADAIVGVSGEGLNVEQRKRLTIGVELAARPKLLLFLDEPTSGLDSQTAWSICQLMRKLVDRGQAILCTIHQPSAMLMKEFDRLLLLAKGGRTIYFGDLGDNCQTLIDYFESHGSEKFPDECNPAEFMLHVIGAAPGSHASQDYHEVWLNSEEYKNVQKELLRLERELSRVSENTTPEMRKEFSAPIWYQYLVVTRRVFEQYWRSPAYLWSKILMGIFSAIFVGFSFFHANTSLQGLQNQMFSLFLFTMVFNPVVQQMLPHYVDQRDLYEVRERPSKTFSWKAFLMAQVTVEIPWNLFVGTLAFFCYYYPVALYRNAPSGSQELHERGALFWLLSVTFYLFSGTLGQACIAGIQLSHNGAMLANTLFMMAVTFCGVLVPKDSLPGFWKFMYRASPMTYIIASMLAVGVAHTEVKCSPREFVSFPPPQGLTCGEYMDPYIKVASGYLKSENATDICEYCRMKYTDDYLARVNVFYSDRWQNWGIFFCYIWINIIFFVSLYWLVRVPKKKNRVAKERSPDQTASSNDQSTNTSVAGSDKEKPAPIFT